MRDRHYRKIWRGLALVLAIATGCGVLRVNIDGEAMAPTLKDGESALATRTFDTLARGDIVSFRYPKDESKSFLKRIVGVPGDRIESKNGSILVDGRPLVEPYVAEANRSADSWGPVTVPDGQYFMMGDNRRNSSDSRSWGLVRRDAIWAKVLLR
jgi:signal peptidase I